MISRERHSISTPIMILAIEPRNPTPILGTLFAAIDERRFSALTSELTLAEVLPKPLARNELGLAEKYRTLMTTQGPLVSVPIDREVLLRAAQRQASMGLKLADAIHVATAEVTACDYFLTFDARLGRALSRKPTWLRPPDLTA